MPLKLLFVAGSLRCGGSEKVLLQILARLNRSAFEPHLALLACDGEFLDRVPGDVRIYSIGVSRARLASVPIARLCWRLRPQVVISFAAHLNTAVLLAKGLLPRGTRVVIREGANITLPEVASSLRRTIYKRLYRRADAVISQSDDMSRRLTTSFGLRRERLFRIHNSVDATALRSTCAGASPFESKGPQVLFVGRLAWIKGPDLLIRAMPEILQTFPSAVLTLVGDGPLRLDLIALAELLGLKDSIRLVGFQENPLPLVRHADLVVIPSRSEAFSNVALEALSLGTPVVATDCPGGMREIAQHTTRMRLSAGDPVSLAKAIQTTISDFRSAQRVPEPEFLREFSLVRMIQAYEELITGNVLDSSCAANMEHMELTTR
jgi:glycosyltransferase involved in cell wall biosynthesis